MQTTHQGTLLVSSNLSENAKEPPDLDHLAGITLISLVVIWQTQHAGIAARSCASGDRMSYPWPNAEWTLVIGAAAPRDPQAKPKDHLRAANSGKR